MLLEQCVTHQKTKLGFEFTPELIELDHRSVCKTWNSKTFRRKFRTTGSPCPSSPARKELFSLKHSSRHAQAVLRVRLCLAFASVQGRENKKREKTGIPSLTFSILQEPLFPVFWLERKGLLLGDFSICTCCAVPGFELPCGLSWEIPSGWSQEIHCHLGCSSGFDFPSKYAFYYWLVRVPRCLLYASRLRIFIVICEKDGVSVCLNPSQWNWNQ